MMKIATALLISATFIVAASSHANKMDDYAAYCTESGGVVEDMPAEISVPSGWVTGQAKTFCNFYPENAFISIGLETFSSEVPSIAATYMKKLGEIRSGSPLMKGPYKNSANNVCKNLGGATITFVADGGFTNQLGQSGICVFGDASMVSSWSLMYMANHREGYDDIKNKVKAEPLDINIPR